MFDFVGHRRKKNQPARRSAVFLIIGLLLFFGYPAMFVQADSINIELEVLEVVIEDDSGGASGGFISGCTDPTAENYNPYAVIANGSCVYQEVVSVPNVGNLTASFSADPLQVNLSWSNPVLADLAGIRIVRKIGSIPLNENDGLLIYDGLAESAVDNNITTAGTYFYAAFVRDGANRYSSGALTMAFVALPPSVGDDPPPDEDITPPDFDTGPIPDPFLDLIEVEAVNELTARLTLADFLFRQTGERIQFFGRNSRIRINGQKDFIVSLPYDKAPERLKTIGVTIYDPEDPSRVFSFLLRVNDNKTAYEANIGRLPGEGVYPINLYIINFHDQTIKRLSGKLIVSNFGFRAEQIILQATERLTASLAVGIGLAAGLSQVAVLSSGVASLADLYLLFLRGLGTLFGFLGLHRRRKPWGTVYDAVTKQPINPAYISAVIADDDNREMASAITDIDGHFGFFLPAGRYRLKVDKGNYRFPSRILAGQNKDEWYHQLYFGETFTTRGEEIVKQNIPLDPLNSVWNGFVKSQTEYFKTHSAKESRRLRIFNLIYAVGFSLVAVSFAISPGFFNLGMLLLYLMIYGLQIFWRFRHKAISVKWRGSGHPLPFSVIRFYPADSGQEVKRAVTDYLGRFYLSLRPGKYYLTVEEKQIDGSYHQVYQSAELELKRGVLSNDIIIDNPSVSPESSADQTTDHQTVDHKSVWLPDDNHDLKK
ncbi:MAG: hypothetical protein WDZ85_00390 [Candidatus Paceibacterota bacterium]